MKKKNFVTLLLGVLGGILFALGMCMALLPEWELTTQGIVAGAAGMAVLLAMVLIRRKMDGKPAIVFSKKAIGITLFGVFSTAVFGAGMCMVLVWQQMLWGIAAGVVGIVLLLCLIPLCRWLQ